MKYNEINWIGISKRTEEHMQKLYIISLANSPYCKRTLEKLIDVLVQNQKYRRIPIEIVDILEKPMFAEKLLIEKYPAFFIGESSIHQGEMIESEIIQMLEDLLV